METKLRTNTNFGLKILVAFVLIVSIDFWSFMPYLENNYNSYFRFPLFGILFFVIITTHRRTTSDYGFDRMLRWTLITIFISSLSSLVLFNQNVVDSFIACVNYTYGALLYFVLRKKNFPINNLINIIVVISIIWCLLEFVQQITYPDFWFSGRYLKNERLEERMGMWRFYIYGVDLVMICFTFFVGKCFGNKDSSIVTKTTGYFKILNIILLILFSCALLIYGSRKHLFVVLLVYILALLSLKGRKFFLYGIILLFVFSFLFVNFFDAFIEMNERVAANQGEGEDFVRIIAAKYFLFDFSNSWIYPIFGAGLPHGQSELSILISNLADMRLHQADCGIIGYYSKFGLFGISAVIWFFILFVKNWKYIDNWLKYFFFIKTVMLFFDFWGMWCSGLTAFAIYLYLLQNNIRINKKYKINNTK